MQRSPAPRRGDELREVRAADLRFVLDQFTAIAAGHNPDAGHRPVPRGLARMLDLTRVGAYGHSLGGPTVIGAMNQDRFDWALRGRGRPLLRGESTRFPEVDFQP